MAEPVRIGRFDQVQIVTTKNVVYLSSPEETVDPFGIWTVTGVVEKDLLISKDSTVVRIPVSDVKLVLQVDTKNIINKIGSILNRGERKREED